MGPPQWVAAAAAADVAGGASSAGVQLFLFHSVLHYGGIDETGVQEGLLGLAARCRLYPSQSSPRQQEKEGVCVCVMDSPWDDLSVAGGGVKAGTSATGPTSCSRTAQWESLCVWGRDGGGA